MLTVLEENKGGTVMSFSPLDLEFSVSGPSTQDNLRLILTTQIISEIEQKLHNKLELKYVNLSSSETFKSGKS